MFNYLQKVDLLRKREKRELIHLVGGRQSMSLLSRLQKASRKNKEIENVRKTRSQRKAKAGFPEKYADINIVGTGSVTNRTNFRIG